MTPWLQEARLDLGLVETAGPRTNARILEMLDEADGTLKDGKTLQNIRDDETPWCSTAVCAWMEAAGIKSPRSAMARSCFLRMRSVVRNHPVRSPFVSVFGKHETQNSHPSSGTTRSSFGRGSYRVMA